MSDSDRLLRVFLCHSSGDKPAVRELYRKLSAEGWINPWLDEEKLYPGQDWDLAIEKAAEVADVVIVCLSNGSVSKEGYIQRELRLVLDIALTKPEETIFIIPLRLEECQPPRRLRAYQYVDYFPIDQKERNYKRMLVSLEQRAKSLGLQWKKEQPSVRLLKPEIGGIEFVRVPAGEFVMGSKDDDELAFDSEKPQQTVDLTYDYWMARFILTNEQYAQYLGKEKHPLKDWQKKKDHPVVNVSWDDAMAYCKWFNATFKSDLGDLLLRLPSEAEWEKAARGAHGNEWSWGNEFDKNKCNSSEGGKGGTTPVGLYSAAGGDSPYGCCDMVGNVWEWTHSLFTSYPYDAKDGRETEKSRDRRVLRGGSFLDNLRGARGAYRYDLDPAYHYGNVGFRVCVAPAHI